MNCCKGFTISVLQPSLVCSSGLGPVPNFYGGNPVAPQPDPLFFQQLSLVETFLSGSVYDDATTEPVWNGQCPLYNVWNSIRPVRYFGDWNNDENYYSVGGKLVSLYAYMYYTTPFDSNFAPTWWFAADCFLSGNPVNLFAQYKDVGDTMVGTYSNYGGSPGWPSSLITSPMTLCKNA